MTEFRRWRRPQRRTGPLNLSAFQPYVDGRGDMHGDVLVLGYSRIERGGKVPSGGAAVEHPLGDPVQ